MASLEVEIQSQEFASEQTKAVINILFTAQWLSNQMSGLLKPFGITHEQFNVLRILRGKHPEKMCQKDIQCRMIARQSNLTLILKKLVEKKLVGSSPSKIDKRAYEIIILRKGLELLEKIDIDSKKEFNHLTLLNTSEAFHLNALLDKLRTLA